MSPPFLTTHLKAATRPSSNKSSSLVTAERVIVSDCSYRLTCWFMCCFPPTIIIYAFWEEGPWLSFSLPSHPDLDRSQHISLPFLPQPTSTCTPAVSPSRASTSMSYCISKHQLKINMLLFQKFFFPQVSGTETLKQSGPKADQPGFTVWVMSTLALAREDQAVKTGHSCDLVSQADVTSLSSGWGFTVKRRENPLYLERAVTPGHPGGN